MRPFHMMLVNLVLLSSLMRAQTPASYGPPSLVLRGEVHPAQKETYFEVPFTVPQHTHRITVWFHNFGVEQHTVMDLGIADPFRFRGASGGNKDHFTIGESDATPSYLPGEIPAGQWKLVIAVPNIRPGVTSAYRAEVWFNSAIDDSSFTSEPLAPQAAWYRGDLHMHDAHSDGSCPSQSGRPVPCPLAFTLQNAVQHGLDFVAVTDHNTTSHYNDERELQPWFDKLLLIPGRELTTFHGHANEFGTTQLIDYRVGASSVPDINSMLRATQQAGGIVSINHPEQPTGEICMGCGWDQSPAADMHLVTAIEVINGKGQPATKFWEEQLRKGYRLTAIGGSDNHHAEGRPDRQVSIGHPTTVVYARNLSVAAILDGIRSGRVFLDTTASRDKLLDFSATAKQSTVQMGETIAAPSGTTVTLQTHVAGCSGDTLHVLLDGQVSPTLADQPVTATDQNLTLSWSSDGVSHWIRAEVRDAENRLVLLGNPIYVNWRKAP